MVSVDYIVYRQQLHYVLARMQMCVCVCVNYNKISSMYVYVRIVLMRRLSWAIYMYITICISIYTIRHYAMCDSVFELKSLQLAFSVSVVRAL